MRQRGVLLPTVGNVSDELLSDHDNLPVPVAEPGELSEQVSDELDGRGAASIRRRGRLTGPDSTIFRPVDQADLGDSSRPEEIFPHWDEIRRVIRHNLTDLGEMATELANDDRQFREWVSDTLNIYREQWSIAPKDETKLVDFLREQLFGYRGLERYLEMENLEEIYFTRWDKGFYVVSGQGCRRIPERIFESEQDFFDFINLIATENGMTVNAAEPVLDAVLKKGGARVAAVIPPIAPYGALTIRKQRETPFTLQQYLETGIITAEAAESMRQLVEGGYHVIVSGGTASGKTSFLNVIIQEWIPRGERLLVLEDTSELKIPHENTVPLLVRQAAVGTRNRGADILMRDLVKLSLRHRGDRIIVGEVRDRAANDAISALNTGHDGSLLTIHANSASSALNRLLQYALAADESKEEALRELIGAIAPIVVQLIKFRDGRRRITEIVQVFHPDDLVEAVGQAEAKEMFDRGEIVWKWEKAAFIRPLYKYSYKEDRLKKVADPLPIQHHAPSA